jgi:hypothetical protein
MNHELVEMIAITEGDIFTVCHLCPAPLLEEVSLQYLALKMIALLQPSPNHSFSVMLSIALSLTGSS